MSDKRISVAPMMGMTDRHFRFMASLLCDKVSLYTPMIHVDAINQSDKNFLQKENKEINFHFQYHFRCHCLGKF